MYKSLFVSSVFHTAVIALSILTLPFIAKQPLDIPPLVSVELIQISDKTNIPFAPKAKKIIEKVKKDNEKLNNMNLAVVKRTKDSIELVAPDLLIKFDSQNYIMNVIPTRASEALTMDCTSD